MNDLDQARAKVLGELIQNARVRAGRSAGDCAQVLNISEDSFSLLESGGQIPSLPDLEVLAMYLNVPMAYFWGSTTTDVTKELDYTIFADIRQRIIGALLRRARLESNRPLEEIADHMDCTVEQLQEYESGTVSVPLFELDRIGQFLGVNLDYFSDEDRGPMAGHEADQKMQKRFEDLPPDIRQFVVEPINLSYVQIAKRLSELDVDRLRGIAEGLLDITF